MTTVVRKLAFFRSGEEHVAGGVAGGVTGGVGGSLQGSIFVCGVRRAAIALTKPDETCEYFRRGAHGTGEVREFVCDLK